MRAEEEHPDVWDAFIPSFIGFFVDFMWFSGCKFVPYSPIRVP